MVEYLSGLEAAQQLPHEVSETMGTIAPVAEWAKASLTGMAQIPGNLGGAAVTKVQTTIADMVNTWMLNHPYTAWFVAHPLITAGLVVVLLIVLRGLLGAIGQLTERIWLAILRLPITLTKWFLVLGTRLFNRATLPQPEQPSTHQQLSALIDRLEALKQEQDELLQQVKAILNSEQRSA